MNQLPEIEIKIHGFDKVKFAEAISIVIVNHTRALMDDLKKKIEQRIAEHRRSA